jgi:rubrerythrin
MRKGKFMAKTEMPHAGHDKHLCYLNNLGFQISHPKEYRELVKDGQYMCKVCGRVAASDKNLCKPVKL